MKREHQLTIADGATRFIMSKLMPHQVNAVYAYKRGDRQPLKNCISQVEKTIYKLKATYDGKIPHWTQGMINHYNYVLDVLHWVERAFHSRRSLTRAGRNGKQAKTTDKKHGRESS